MFLQFSQNMAVVYMQCCVVFVRNLTTVALLNSARKAIASAQKIREERNSVHRRLSSTSRHSPAADIFKCTENRPSMPQVSLDSKSRLPSTRSHQSSGPYRAISTPSSEYTRLVLYKSLYTRFEAHTGTLL